MPLVEYGSGSDADTDSDLGTDLHRSSTTTVPSKSEPSSATVQSTAIQTSIRLPPPKRNKPTKARILLAPAKHPTADIEPGNPKRSQFEDAYENTEHPKRPKLELPIKKSGLAAMLPAPKNAAPSPKAGSVMNKSQGLPLKRISSRVSPALSHIDQPINYGSSSVSTVPSSSAEQDQPVLNSSSPGHLNLFGLPSSSISSNYSMEPTSSTTPLISSAPQVAEEKPPPPTLSDPYPGYWQRANGKWCARSADDEEWKAFHALHYGADDISDSSKEVPKDFFKQRDGRNSAMEEFDAAKVAKLAWENKPKIIDPREEARREQAAQAAAKPAKQVSARARGRHQLSSLLSEAQSNRAELEDRISRGKFNRKAGGAKYGLANRISQDFARKVTPPIPERLQSLGRASAYSWT